MLDWNFTAVNLRSWGYRLCGSIVYSGECRIVSVSITRRMWEEASVPYFNATRHFGVETFVCQGNCSYSRRLPYQLSEVGTPNYRTPGYRTSGYRTPGYRAPGNRTPGYRTPGYRTPPSPLAWGFPSSYRQSWDYRTSGEFRISCVLDRASLW